jgi:hypothetical protein
MDSKRCPKCQKEKPLGDFYLWTRSRSSWCKACSRESQKARRMGDPEAFSLLRSRRRLERIANGFDDDFRGHLRLYGLTVAGYEKMLADQDGRCAICGGEETAKLRGRVRRLCVDHDHETGQVRGLLCSRCNTMLGLARSNCTILERAANYIVHHYALSQKVAADA